MCMLFCNVGREREGGGENVYKLPPNIIFNLPNRKLPGGLIQSMKQTEKGMDTLYYSQQELMSSMKMEKNSKWPDYVSF